MPALLTIPRLLGLAAGLAVTVWAYWPTLLEAGEKWVDDPQYSHGFLVPIFSMFLLWSRKARLDQAAWRPNWLGLVLIAGAILLRVASHKIYFTWFDDISFLLCLAGLVLAAGGWKVLRWALPSILFLFFMFPLPHRAQFLLGDKLQKVATLASTYLLQTAGVPAVADGNIILLTETPLKVAEACNGLSMLVTFFALSTAFALLAKRTWWERLIIVLSAVPIAILANVIRITITGLLFEYEKGDLARRLFHDGAGWLMMPIALVLLALELHVLGKIFVPVKHSHR